MKQKKKYTVAIWGAGWIGLGAEFDVLRIAPRSHAQSVLLNAKTTLAAFVDPDKTALSRAEQLYPSVPTFSSPQEMFKKLIPDMVIIASNPDHHATLIETASIARVKAILCEKPISHSVTDAVLAVRTARKHRTLLFVNHMRRFDPLIRKYREHMRGGYVRDTFIGKVITANAYYDKGIFHGGTHMIDFLQFFLGPVRWVSAVMKEKTKDDFIADVYLGFAGGAVSALQYFDSTQYGLSEVSFFGEKGKLTFRNMTGLEIETVGIRSSKEYSSYNELDYRNARIEGSPRSFLGPTLDHMIDCLEGRDTPVSSGEDALRALKVIWAIKKSAEGSGKRVIV